MALPPFFAKCTGEKPLTYTGYNKEGRRGNHADLRD